MRVALRRSRRRATTVESEQGRLWWDRVRPMLGHDDSERLRRGHTASVREGQMGRVNAGRGRARLCRKEKGGGVSLVRWIGVG